MFFLDIVQPIALKHFGQGRAGKSPQFKQFIDERRILLRERFAMSTLGTDGELVHPPGRLACAS